MILVLAALLVFQPAPAMLAALYEQEFERKKQAYGTSDPRTIQAARDLGLFLSKNGAAGHARKVFLEVVSADEKTLGAKSNQTLADVASLANLSEPDAAEPLWRRASESPEFPVAARAFAALGQLRESAGDLPGAARFYEQALDHEERAVAEAVTVSERARLAMLAGGVAQVLGQVSEPPAGIAALQRALVIERSVLGPRHPETATLQANLAGVLLDANAVDESLRLIVEALEILEQTMGSDHPRVAISATILAHGLRAKGEFRQAERNYRRALAIDERAYGPKHAQTAEAVRTLAEFLRERGRSQEAAALERRLVNAPR